MNYRIGSETAYLRSGDYFGIVTDIADNGHLSIKKKNGYVEIRPPHTVKPYRRPIKPLNLQDPLNAKVTWKFHDDEGDITHGPIPLNPNGTMNHNGRKHYPWLWDDFRRFVQGGFKHQKQFDHPKVKSELEWVWINLNNGFTITFNFDWEDAWKDIYIAFQFDDTECITYILEIMEKYGMQNHIDSVKSQLENYMFQLS